MDKNKHTENEFLRRRTDATPLAVGSDYEAVREAATAVIENELGIDTSNYTPGQVSRDLAKITMMKIDMSLNDREKSKRLEDAYRDPYNPNVFNGLGLRVEIERLGQKGAYLVMTFDLEGFKWVNDTLGHPAGDAVLEAFGQALVDLSRSGTIVARPGGDEFVVIMPIDPNATEGDIENTVERFRTALNGSPESAIRHQLDARTALPLSGRVGYDVVNFEAGQTIRGGIETADARMTETGKRTRGSAPTLVELSPGI